MKKYILNNRKLLIILLTILICGIVYYFLQTAPSKKNNNALIIDIRTAADFNFKHYKNAINIEYNLIPSQIKNVAPDKNTTIYLYCITGRTSEIVKRYLKKIGYQNVVNLGGYESAEQQLTQMGL